MFKVLYFDWERQTYLETLVELLVRLLDALPAASQFASVVNPGMVVNVTESDDAIGPAKIYRTRMKVCMIVPVVE